MQKSWRIERVKWLRIVILSLILSWSVNASAQYYSWGADHPSHSWQSIESSGFEVVYSDSTSSIARRVLYYLNSLEESLGEGFSHFETKFPVVIHPENFFSNGMAMWAPRRVEFISTPNEGNYSTLWIKQLAAHEYRHVVQYNTLNQGVVKWLSYILGEQGAAAGFAFMPLYAIEGDAVLFETQTSSFGRALQPSFSMAYRAIGREILEGDRYHQKWFAGSYTEHIPDHYELGYQLTAYGYTKYGVDMWDKVFSYAVRHPYVVVTTRRAMKKYYNTTIPSLLRETFEELNDYWDSMPQAENLAEVISTPQGCNYTIYSHPIEVDGGDIIALKQDFDTPSHFVSLDPESREEQRVKRTGYISSRPDYGAGRVWWSEYRPSLLFAEKIDSKVCYLDIESGKKGVVKGIDNALYPTPIGDNSDHFAYVEYHYSGRYTVVERLNGEEIARTTYPSLCEIHGLAWDDKTDALYVIITTDDGMWLGACHDGEIKPLTQPAYITLSDLRAAGGKLYFGSIASGRDEIHSLDIASREQMQLTSSTYGAFDTSRPTAQGDILLTTYNKLGYHLSTQREDALNRAIEPSKLPLNIVNPPCVELDVINVDTLRFNSADSLASLEHAPSSRFRKGSNLFNIHSWAPVKYNPFSLSTEDVGLGVTLLSQNLLSTAQSYVAYGWNSSDRSSVEAAASFWGLGLQFDIAAKWGGYQNISTYYLVAASEGGVLAPDIPSAKHRYSLSTAVTLPLYFSGGYMSSSLYLSSSFSLSNDRVQSFSGYQAYLELLDLYKLFEGAPPSSLSSQLLESIDRAGFSDVLTSLSFNASHSRLARLATRDIYSRLGYVVGTSYTLNPTDRDFSSLVAAAATAYLPGVTTNHSLRVAASYQTQVGGYKYNGIPVIGYQSTTLIPKGYTISEFFSQNLYSTEINYSFPICYPNIGIPATIFIKRVRANIGAGYARFDNIYTKSGVGDIYSYGGDLSIDFTPLRLPDAATTSITFSLYKPQNKSLYFSFGLDIAAF